MIDPVHLVSLGGAIGAVFRYLINKRLQYDGLPIGTLTVNTLGSFVLGAVLGIGTSEELLLFVGVGACGAFTTYSSFSFETVRLWEGDERLRATLYAVGTLGSCLLGLWVGVTLTATLIGTL